MLKMLVLHFRCCWWLYIWTWSKIYLSDFVESPAFRIFILITIVINSIFIAVQTGKEMVNYIINHLYIEHSKFRNLLMIYLVVYEFPLTRYDVHIFTHFRSCYLLLFIAKLHYHIIDCCSIQVYTELKLYIAYD